AMVARHSRQSFLGPNSEQVLSDLQVAIVGLGGGGAHIAQQLVHIGIRNFVLLDPDIVEESNLNRLVGATQADERKRTPKVRVSERLIKGVNKKAQVTVRQVRWQEAGDLLRDRDFVFGCVDSFSARDELERAARRYL